MATWIYLEISLSTRHIQNYETKIEKKKTALIIAAEKSRTRVVKVLIAAGANVNAEDKAHI